MLNNQQKAQLRKLSHDQKVIGQIGKDGLSTNLLSFLEDALESHELIKIRALKNCSLSINEITIEINRQLHSELVISIGRTMVFYRRSKEKPIIRLVK